MEDIIIDDRRQVSARVSSREKKEQKKYHNKRTFGQYLLDFLIKGLLVSSLIAIDFVLFTRVGSYTMFTGFQTINPEAVFILAFLAGSVFLINFLLSFSRFLQNLWIAAVAAFCTSAILNQFALFDKRAILAGKFENILPFDVINYLNYNSHIVIITAITLITFLFVHFASRLHQTYLLAILLFILGWNIGSNYMSPMSTNFKTTYDNPPAISSEDEEENERLIYLNFVGLSSYENTKTIASSAYDSQKGETTKTNAEDIMLGFYTQNNFKLYANAYSTEQQPFFNVVTALNSAPNGKPALTYTLDNVLLQSYWDFDNLHSPTLYLKSNKLFKRLSKKDYQIKVYETHKLETCYTNNEIAVSKCVNKKNLPFNMETTNLTTAQKTILLFNQWLESTGNLENINILNDVFKLVLSPQDFPMAEFSSLQLSIIHSFKILDIIARDIEKDENKNAYFAIIEMPADMYIYDSFCKLKPISRWMTIDSNNSVLKKEAYMEQISCLYGQLENFIQKISNANRLRNTTIIIQGLNTPRKMLPLLQNNDLAQQIEQKTVNLAVYRSENTKPEINYDVCPINELLQTVWNSKKTCVPFSEFNLDQENKEEITKYFANKHLSQTNIEHSLSSFLKWYQIWAEANGTDNNLKNLVQKEETTQAPEDTKLKEVPIADVTEELPKEEKTQSLSEAVKNTQEQDVQEEAVKKETTNASEVKNQTPDTPDKKIKIDVKVIDTETPQDVIPPFIDNTDDEVPQPEE